MNAPLPVQPQASGAVPALVLGILSVVLCPLCGPFAWSLGHKAEREVDASGHTLGGRGLATAGKILGIVGTVLLILLVLWLVVLVLGVTVTDEGGSSSTGFD